MPIRIEGELPELTAAIARLEKLAAQRGLSFTTANDGGIRSEADTLRDLKYRDDDYAAYVKQLRAHDPKAVPLDKYRWRPINAFGTSYHNFGAARDLRMLTGTLAELGKLAPAAGLKWGGEFRDAQGKPRPDYPHFQLPITLLEARARWLARGNTPGAVTPAVSLAAGAAAAAITLVVGLVAMYARARGA
jgi:hypothetical protein